MIRLTENTLKLIVPFIQDKNLKTFLPIFDILFPAYKINTKERVACFISQIAHESSSLNKIIENLNYSAEGLIKVFPKYFPSMELALQYQRKPEMIANKVYANRMGNGDESSGDGWKFRGRSLIHCTGKDNYRACSLYLFGDERLLKNPELLEEPENAVKAALWYWHSRKLNDIADLDKSFSIIIKGYKRNKFEYLTIKINGGLNGYADRLEFYQRAQKYLI